MRNRPWLVFALVFVWKIALFVFTVQPIPANDAFFYDGAVVHHVLHGGYFNPTIAQAFPISGREIFSGYPPLYQLPLLAWMSVFGVSAPSAMALHLILFGLYLLVVLAIFRRLQLPAWCVNAAGVFLFAFTFHDRPDSLAHFFGVLALYACVRSRKILGGDSAQPKMWESLMASFVVLAVCTSLQIGGIYFLVVCIATIAACRLDKARAPWAAMSLMVLVPIALVGLVIAAMPRAWTGFLEHLRETPTITGLRLAHWQELAKLVRTVPGILLVAVLLPLSWFKQQNDFESDAGRRYEVILLATVLPSFVILIACATIIGANTVAIAGYLQPLVVACYLAFSVAIFHKSRWMRAQMICFALAMALVSVRAVGMTTWGVACAMDVSYQSATRRIETELAAQPAGSTVVMSSAFLYGAAKHGELNLVHSDWMSRAHGDSHVTDAAGIERLRPRKIILTQYDYYRRFQAVLDDIKTTPGLQDIKVENMARTRAPDSFKTFQQVVQHISWAPVIVTLTWRE